jgi:outer membrane protein, multidrug efflux system
VKRVFIFLVATLACLLFSGGCMKLGPDYKRPDTGIRVPGAYQYSPTEKVTLHPEDRWWEFFDNPELNRIVDEALRNNLDIKKAAAVILEARSRFVRTRADRFPFLGFQGRVQRQRQTVEVSVPTFEGGRLKFESQQQRQTFDSHNLSLPASFELDLWGRLARAEEGARADLLMAEEGRRTVAQTVVAETIHLYLLMEALERRLHITEESIANFRRSLALVESRYERGLTSILAVRQARRILAQAEALLPSMRQELGITQQKLAVLLGRYPETRPARLHEEDYFKCLAPVPAGLPSELLMRRPDIRAAEAQLKALNAQVGVAVASRFPQITLTAGFGYSSNALSELFRPESELWNLAVGIVQPLFDAGKLKAVQRGAEARYEQGVAEYAKAVLSAFSEVESALLTRKEQLERRERELNFREEARATQEVAETRYERGLVDYLTVLDAQQTRFQAEDKVVQVDFSILSNRVTLHRALGGGWGEPN